MMIVKVTCFKLGDKLNEGKVCKVCEEELILLLHFATVTFNF